MDKINERVERLLEENVEENRMVWNGRFPDLKSRYSLCRKAKKKTLAIAKLVRDGKFGSVLSCTSIGNRIVIIIYRSF